MENYIKLIEELLSQNKTTGDNHSEAMIHYTKMNVKRLQRWLSKGELLPETIELISKIDQKQHWIVLTEAWCGDAAHSLGFMQKMAELNPNITLEWRLRDENLDLMDQFLTNGGRSIPKLIARDENGKDIFNWGPRPAYIQKKYLELREAGIPYSEISIELQKLYNKDKGVTMQKEINALLEESLCVDC